MEWLEKVAKMYLLIVLRIQLIGKELGDLVQVLLAIETEAVQWVSFGSP